MLFFIPFFLVTIFSSYSLESTHIVEEKPYTAQQHLEEVKNLFNDLKYEESEPDFSSSKEAFANLKLDLLYENLEKSVQKESNNVILYVVIPIIENMISKSECLTVPPSKALSFYISYIDIIQKRDAQLALLTKEEEELLKNELQNLNDRLNNKKA